MRHSLSDRLLSLTEVRRIGRPALFLDWGEQLLFRDETIFDLHETDDGRGHVYPPKELPAQMLETAAGIDYGWRHLTGCDCTLCCESEGEQVNDVGERAEAA
jgi:hypothetical protein